ncbi:aspartate/glutamate racemase family protein [Streptomyces sp. CT34]|uniref:aspartate/glutamate racemase family protein n=1 Tax=Streptomyces sp. CT34 TaxID=1553907 RepID=UPI000691D1CC|nr:aspartate/glutamate racemase family protein [Streptomyces sp. CT34]
MLTLLHTSPVHVPVFDGLRDQDAAGLPLRHLVRPELLAMARESGPDAVAEEVAGALAGAAGDGAAAVLCTCSTIGAVAEAAGAALDLPVLRVDRPMAAAAVAAGTRITVLATVESTLAPTAELLAAEADRAGRTVRVRAELVPGAWDRYEAGDTEGCVAAVAAAARRVRDAGDTDAIVLAQVSIAAVADRLAADAADGGGPVVLSSPRHGLRAAARLTGGAAYVQGASDGSVTTWAADRSGPCGARRATGSGVGLS